MQLVALRRTRWVAGLTLLAAGGLAAAVDVPPARAATCSVMTFQFDPTAGAVFSPSTLTVANGACVTLHNATITSAQFTVGAKYKATAPAFSDATPNYVAGPAGTHQAVTGTGAAGTAHGTIIVKPAPKPSPKPSHSASPSHSPRPAQSPKSSPQPSSTPQSPLGHTPTAAPPPTSPLVSPPVGSSPFLAGNPTPTPSSSSTAPAVLSGPLQPPTDRGTGLPAALAALAVVGTAGALLRVLLAEPVGPVDERRTVGAAS